MAIQSTSAANVFLQESWGGHATLNVAALGSETMRLLSQVKRLYSMNQRHRVETRAKMLMKSGLLKTPL
jgi:hypothetical protein